MEIKKYIQVTDNNLSLNLISNFIKFSSSREYKTGTVIGGENQNEEDIKKVRDVKIHSLSPYSESLSDVHWFNLVVNVIKNNVNIYKKKCPHFEYSLIQDISILKYEKLGHYDWHTDHAAAAPRTLSTILFLNNDYIGGELMFKDQITNEELTINPKPGRLIMWPSNFVYPHTVVPVKHGIRYTVVGWLV
jgi:hypothetical protein